MGARFGLCPFAGVVLRLPIALVVTRSTPFVAALGVGLAATGEIGGWCLGIVDCWGSCPNVAHTLSDIKRQSAN